MPQMHEVEVERDVAMRMRDGVDLLADIYTPAGEGPFPVLLLRSPYDKSTSEYFSLLHPEWYARHGFIVVTQDTRGCYASGGRFEPFHHETADGVDTIAQCAALPKSSGKVGMYGFSYPGLTQLFPATQRPPALAAIAPTLTCDGLYQDWMHRNGVLQLAFVQTWAAALAIPEAFRHGGEADIRPALKALNAIAADYDHLPLTTHPGLGERFAPFYKEWLSHPTFDDYWRQWHLADRYGDIAVPAIHIGGWYDIFVEGTIRNFVGLSRGAATPEARAAQKLVIGPWYHQPWGPIMAQTNFGPEGATRVDETVLRWYEHWLMGVDNGIMREPRVSLFMMGANRWRHADAFPLPESRYESWYLHSGGRANSLSGDGVLDRTAPGDEHCDIYVCDPLYPVASLGGRSCCPAELAPMGPMDQRPVEMRPDVLVYTSGQLAEDLEVTGPVDIVLYASSTADDTDFAAKLVDVFPDGRAINLVDGILRASFRDSLSDPTPIEPGRINRYAFRIGHTCNLFRPGHRIRLEIAGTNFPLYERTLNHFRRDRDGGYRDARTATQKVFHDSMRPSYLVLSVIPGS